MKSIKRSHEENSIPNNNNDGKERQEQEQEVSTPPKQKRRRVSIYKKKSTMYDYPHLHIHKFIHHITYRREDIRHSLTSTTFSNLMMGAGVLATMALGY